MPGDEVAVGTGLQRRSTTGPRHAAPRRSILVRLQVPAGKAIALAAMPSAVLMGMGLTPRLAEADEMPKNGYAPGECVTAPDIPGEEDVKDVKDAATSPSAGPSGSASGSPAPSSSSPSPSASESTDDDAGARRSQAEPEPPAESGASMDVQDDRDDRDDRDDEDGGDESAEPSPSQSSAPEDEDEDEPGLFDPILDPIKDFFTPGWDEDDEDDEAPDGPAPTPSPSASAPADEPGSEPGGEPRSSAEEPEADNAARAAEDDGETATEPEPEPEDADAEAADEPEDSTASPTPSPSALASEAIEEPETGPLVDAQGREFFPCPEEREVAGENEQTPNTLPNKPWVLKSTLLALHGLDYQGVVNVRTQNGGTKQVLKFTASGIDIRDLHQLVDGGEHQYHVEARKGSTSTFRKGTVTMYTERLKGNLLGIIPITFDPEHPPPLNLPEIFFTDVTVTQAGQFGGELTIPGMHVYSTPA